MATTYVDQVNGSGPSPVPVDQITGSGETVAMKAPCRLASTGNLVLNGLQSIDGTMTAINDRVLVRLQTDQKQNGIWIASAGPWQRARDFDSNRDITRGTRLTVIEGATLAGKEYLITSPNPIVVGTSNITFAETLSSDAGSSAAAAEAARAAAVIAKNGAEAAQGAAAASAGAASTSAGNAATSESNAAGSAGTAVGAAGTAVAAAGAASTDADDAETARAAAVAAKNAAEAAAGAASTSETNAGASATAAAASASATATAMAALSYRYSTTQSDADPGGGIFRLNALPASATAAYIDNADFDGVNVTGLLDSWDDAAASVRGSLTIRSKSNPAVWHQFNVTGSVVDGSGYRKLTLAYVGGAGTFANALQCWLIFSRGGNDGAGDVDGPASSTMGGFVRWDSTNGTLVKDSPATIGTADIGNNQVTLAKLAQGTALSILGVAGNATVNYADIVASTADRLFGRVGNALGFFQVSAAMITDAVITYAKMASAAISTGAELLAGTASKLVSAASVHDAMAWMPLTAGASVPVVHSDGFNRSITHTANATIGAPSSVKPGMPLNIDITPAGFTTSWNSAFKFGAGGAPSITARTLVHFICRQSGEYVFLGTSDPS